jgi:hypothetical protein
MAALVIDRSMLVRQTFYKILLDWLKYLPDKCDHDSRIFPYLMTGLYDTNPDISEFVVEQMEELGIAYEEDPENEITLRD